MDYPKKVPGIGLVDGKFVDEDAISGKPGSLIPCKWGNSVTDEVLNVVRAAGIEPDEESVVQLRDAIISLIEKKTALSYTPVQQGGVEGQDETVAVKIGKSKEGEGLLATVGEVNYGRIVFSGELENYLPVNGRAYSASHLFFEGVDCTFHWSGQSGQPKWLWGGDNPDNMYVYSPANFRVSYADTANHANSSGYANSAGSTNSANYANSAGRVGGVTHPFHSPDGRILQAWTVGNGFVSITVDKVAYGIPLHLSDARLKENIRPSDANALDVINKIKLFSFNYRGNDFLDSSRSHRVGFVAQQLIKVDTTFAMGAPDGDVMMSPNLLPIVAHLVKAVQELSADAAKTRSMIESLSS